MTPHEKKAAANANSSSGEISGDTSGSIRFRSGACFDCIGRWRIDGAWNTQAPEILSPSR
jgi:hypothetical protein